MENEIISTTENFYSYHVFFFPFKWRYKEKKGEILDEQLRLGDFSKLIQSSGSSWKPNVMENPPDSILMYNEVNYFHDFARKALYDEGKKDSFLRHFEYQLEGNENTYNIKYDGRTYTLDLDSILLNIYNTGVGVLSFHLFNRKQDQSSPQDILNINQYGRRIFPPFLSADLDNIGKQSFFEYAEWHKGADDSKNAEIAEELRLCLGGREIKENFEPKSIPPRPGQLPNIIKDLLPSKVFTELDIKHTIDDRMFVLSWYGNAALTQEMKQTEKNDFVSDKPFYAYKQHEWWFKYLFVDGGMKTCQNDPMTFELLEDHTNARWVGEYGTLYGISRYSFVSLTAPLSTTSLVSSHIMSMYYKIVEICLLQRACILRFSDEVAEISRLEPLQNAKDRRQLSNKVNSLYRQYIRFVNKIYFREITAQDQGIELYDLLQKHMRIERDVKDLDSEIQELYQYSMMIEEKRRNDTLEKITVFGTYFIIPSFIVGFFGMNIVKFDENIPQYLLAFAGCIILPALAIGIFRSEKETWKWIYGIVFLILLITLLLMPLKFM